LTNPSDELVMAARKLSRRMGADEGQMTLERAIESDGNELRLAFADEPAFRAFYDRSMPRVFAYLVSRGGGDRDLAEELTQQTFVAAVAHRHTFDGRSDSLTWLCGIARHKLADHFRHLERDERRQFQLEVRESTFASDSRAWGSADERTAIGAAIARLPVAQRAALLFVDLDDRPVREVARLLGRSERATQSLVTRARANFRRVYDKEPIDG
jgi:RNA polymerase sigma-70 factor (ECF subfamily)